MQDMNASDKIEQLARELEREKIINIAHELLSKGENLEKLIELLEVRKD